MMNNPYQRIIYDRKWFIPFPCFVLALLICSCSLQPIHASSNRSSCINNLLQMGVAFENYRETNGKYPTDIYDENGNPLLSWRVRLLPYLEEDSLYKQFRINESWDSDHNRQLIAKIPRIFRCPSCPSGDGLTCYSIPRGGETVLSKSKADDWREISGSRAATIVLIEVDADHSVVWTKPDDWNYDPANPLQGLGNHHISGFARIRGCMALFGDKKVRFIPEGIDPDFFRSCVSVEADKQGQWTLPSYQTLFSPRIGVVVGISLVISLCGVGGIFLVFPRLLKGKPVSPGEFLWLMVGMQQLTLLISVLVRFEPAPRLSGWDQQWTLWFLPCLVGNLTCGFGVIKFWRFWPWQVFFAIIFSFFILFTLDSRIPHYHRAAEESFITAVSPTLLGFAGVATAWISHSWKNYPARDERAIFHWVGILVCLLPFFWFAVCLFLGLVHPRELSVRIRE